MALSPEGLLALGKGARALHLRDLGTGAGRVLDLPRTSPYSLKFSPDGALLAVVGRRCWLVDVTDSARDVRPWEGLDQQGGLLAAFDPDGRTLFVLGWWGRLAAVDLETGTATLLSEDPWEGLMSEAAEYAVTTDLACSPDGQWLALSAAAYSRGAFRALHLPTGRWLDPPLPSPRRSVHALAFAPDGKTLVVGGESAQVSFWDLSTKGEVGRLRWPGPEVARSAMAFSPDGHTLALADSAGVVRLWPWRRLLEGR
jgi:WD40 repeat protein